MRVVCFVLRMVDNSIRSDMVFDFAVGAYASVFFCFQGVLGNTGSDEDNSTKLNADLYAMII